MTLEIPAREAVATKQGDALIAEVSHTMNPAKKVTPKNYPVDALDPDLRAWFNQAQDGEQIPIRVHVNYEGKPTKVELRDRPVLTAIAADAAREAVIAANGGFINPYTFIPTLPRADLTEGLGELGLGDSGPAGPPSHARIAAGQWSGVIRVRLTLKTPLLIPDTQTVTKQGERKIFDIRTDVDGMPLIHPTSLKGALRSAFETVTASRFGVFTGSELPLAYRPPAGQGADLVPAVVVTRADGETFFRLCLGDTAWRENDGTGTPALSAAWVPAYNAPGRSLVRLGSLATTEFGDLHARKVAARLRLYERVRFPQATLRIWRTTHLLDGSAAELRTQLEGAVINDPERPTKSLTLLRDVAPRFDEGILSITGHSIATKHEERFFVLTDHGVPDIPVQDEDRMRWQAILEAYGRAAEYNTVQDRLTRSHHVTHRERLLDLPAGTPVYLKLDGTKVTGAYPVMISRKPFETSPSSRLEPSLRPANSAAEISPAERLFGWTPPNGADRPHSPRAASTGYRGRLLIGRSRCLDQNWRPEVDEFPRDGVILAPLSSPKPTQFRFYAAQNPSGSPIENKAPKENGYQADGGLRGRKAYRWSERDQGYWKPTAATDNGKGTPREYLDLADDGASATQTVRYRSWVRPGTRFEVDLRIDGVGGAELGALIWLLNRSEAAPLRLGAGKPLGFGVVATEVIWGDDNTNPGTELHDSEATAIGWRSLRRPGPADRARIDGLAAAFETGARRHPVLAEAVESYLTAAGSAAQTVHYPRETATRTTESYKWFVNNENINWKELTQGWSLPHIRNTEPQLPYLPGNY